jgi:hypothetical protein
MVGASILNARRAVLQDLGQAIASDPAPRGCHHYA